MFNPRSTLIFVTAMLLSVTCSPLRAQPSIEIDPTLFNFGKLEEGIEVKHVFVIRNKGNEPLVIKEVKSTCGCTVPKLQQPTVAPNSSTQLEVIMDTSLKQGEVKKELTVYSNDPAHSTTTIFVLADVKDPHADLSGDIGAKLFRGRCAACHVNRGIGKSGEELYVADCAMCHGFAKNGGVASGLFSFDYHDQQVAGALRKIIANGSETRRSMVGYAKESGGPLDKQQIDSLIKYLQWRSDVERKATK